MMKTKICIFLYILIGIALGFFLKLFVIDVLNISGNSMNPTLKNGSKVVVNKLAYGIVKPFSGEFYFQWKEPERGDVVIYLHDNKIVVKRCVAVGGDHLEFLQNSGYSVKVAETDSAEIPLTPLQYQKMKKFGKIPEGYIFALGDNLSDSIDSRDYGFVSVKNIAGKIVGK